MFEIFELNIIKRAFIVISFIAPLAPIFGVFLLLRRYAFFADTLAHVGFLAIALSIFFKINSLILLIFLSIMVAISVEQLRSRDRLPAEGSLSFFLYAGVALSVVFITFAENTGSIMSILFGSLSTVTNEDVYLIIATALVCLSFLFKYHKKLLNLCIDEEIAHACGINTTVVKMLFAIAVALSISISIKTMGALLIGALMIIPPLTAMQFCKTLRNTVILSVIFSLLSSYAGIFLSYYSGIPLGAAISTVLIFFFLVSLIFKVFK
ncbi:zinc transport system permease protein [Thermodesulfovibrio aggregans]|uniref:Zinc transport system permease protein n=1 Tax=Thermodesulfovibrio aggregans TaxID=86166 RepID=A0A0U9HVK1_9BACT|nr:metal ABC transporter permease [Thermodesulfovibrio aggregans]GAQ94717.1 zinc transport system permease protein [Thermodesulfovibrio aggregans]